MHASLHVMRTSPNCEDLDARQAAAEKAEADYAIQ